MLVVYDPKLASAIEQLANYSMLLEKALKL